MITSISIDLTVFLYLMLFCFLKTALLIFSFDINPSLHIMRFHD